MDKPENLKWKIIQSYPLTDVNLLSLIPNLKH